MITARVREKHGETYSPEYRIWTNLCYGARRGIRARVCPQWAESFAAFLAHVGRRPTRHHSLDRIDNSGAYEPGNVRWATARVQGRNRSTNRRLTFDGVSMCITDWAILLRVSCPALHRRVMAHGEAAAIEHYLRKAAHRPAEPPEGWRVDGAGLLWRAS